MWNFFFKIAHQFQLIFSQLATRKHDCLSYYLVTKIHVRLCCDSYHVFRLYVTVKNPHNRWQHTANLRENIFKRF